MEEIKNEKKHYFNEIRVITDEMDSHRYLEKVIGWYEFNCKKGKYYNLDDIRTLYENGETENVVELSDGQLYIRKSIFDSCITFTVQCGIPFGLYYPNLLEYAKKVGIVTNNPRPVKMFAGIKSVNEYYGKSGKRQTTTYEITYKINHDVVYGLNKDYLSKIANGFINRITQDIGLISSYEYCKYYDETYTISICGLSSEDMEKIELIEEFKSFDIELLMLKSNDLVVITQAYRMACRDLNKYRWICEEKDSDEKKSNCYWWDKPRKNEKMKNKDEMYHRLFII